MSDERPDPFRSARAVADAVLYEGYVLYPYRASSAKNVTRWQFGVLMPPGYADPSERSACRTELVCEAKAGAVLDVRVRFLHVVHRSGGDGPEWDETAERQADLRLPVADLRAGPYEHPFAFGGSDAASPSVRVGRHDAASPSLRVGRHDAASPSVRVGRHDAASPSLRVGRHDAASPSPRVGRHDAASDGVRREVAAVAGAVVVALEPLPGPYAGAGRLSVRVENRTPGSPPSRDAALRTALVAAHTMLAGERVRFLSMTDPPEWASGAVAACANEGTWPVLVGSDSVVLSSPIILGDHPEIAPESPGDLYDATEIDEILTLRTMTLTDAEKAEARATDPRAAALIDRVDGLPPEVLDRLHGALRYLRHATGEPDPLPDAPPDVMAPQTPWWDPGADASVDPETDAVLVDGVEVRRGCRVRLCPSRPGPGGAGRRTDAQDLFLTGRTATVEAVLHDVDGQIHIGVTPDDDEELAELTRWHGRYLYFAPDELEPLEGRPRRVLVAGVGNVFLSDDGFGVEVVGRFAGRPVPDGVTVKDFGIRGVHLAYELLEGYDALILVDAAPRGRPPGTVSLLRVDQNTVEPADPALLDAHGLEPGAILRMLGSLGGAVGEVLVVACEPESVAEGIGLGPAVAGAVQPAVELLERVIAEQARTPQKEVSR